MTCSQRRSSHVAAITSRKRSLSVDPRSGDVWLLPDESSSALRITADGEADWVPLADGSGRYRGLHVGDDGRLYAIAGGQIRSFHIDGRRAGDTPFDGLPASRRLRIVRGWTNVGPDTETGPEWSHVLPLDPD